MTTTDAVAPSTTFLRSGWGSAEGHLPIPIELPLLTCANKRVSTFHYFQFVLFQRDCKSWIRMSWIHHSRIYLLYLDVDDIGFLNHLKSILQQAFFTIITHFYTHFLYLISAD